MDIVGGKGLRKCVGKLHLLIGGKAAGGGQGNHQIGAPRGKVAALLDGGGAAHHLLHLGEEIVLIDIAGVGIGQHSAALILDVQVQSQKQRTQQSDCHKGNRDDKEYLSFSDKINHFFSPP